MSNPKGNVDRLLKARAEIDEELRHHKGPVTILFTDVVGSTAYFERYGDTAGLAMLHRQTEVADAVVPEYRGRVIKTIGDSVMAEFPEPVLAVRAAVELQRRLLQQNQSLPEREQVLLRMGIHAGVGFRSRGDVYGDAVNLAARITKQSGPAQILLSRVVREAVGTDPALPCNWLGKIPIEGKAEKEDIFEVVWTDPGVYSALRERVTRAYARGELVARGLGFEEAALVGPGGPTEESLGVMSAAPLTMRYDILGEIGRGGMGTIYKARDRETGDLMALKVLKPEIAADPVVLERFKNELRLARKISHRHVCRIYEFNRIDDLAYITMEYVEGESLRHILNRFGTLSVRKGIEIAGQICAALREAHAQGVLHRDLKPENVMLDGAGNVKVMDFGVARSVQSDTAKSGSIIGTPAYMAPEQAEGKAVDARADIYALGLILYEMFSGAPAFSGDTPVVIALKQIRETPPRPGQIEPTLPVRLENIILKCLEKDPDERLQSVEELEAALKEFLEVCARERAAAALVRRSRRQVQVAAGLLLAAGLGLVLFLTREKWRPGPEVASAVPQATGESGRPAASVPSAVPEVAPERPPAGVSPAAPAEQPGPAAEKGSTASAPATGVTTEPASESARPAAPREPPVRVQRNPPAGIYLQAASYRTQAVAKAVAHELLHQGLPALVVPREGRQQVWVGPYKDKEQAKLVRQQLAGKGFPNIRQVTER